MASHFKRVGPITIEVAPGRPAEGDRPGVSPTYRNVAATDGLPETFEGVATLYEAFNASVDRFGDCNCVGWRPVGEDGKAGPYEFLTYKETKERATWFASALSQACRAAAPPGPFAPFALDSAPRWANLVGFQPKDRLGIYAANKVEWMLALRGVDMLSGTIVPIYDSLGESAVQYIVNHSESTIALVESAKLVAFTNVLSQVFSFDEFQELGESKVGEFSPVPPKPEDLCCIMYTRNYISGLAGAKNLLDSCAISVSGTTGTPKGVMHTHRAMVSGFAAARVLIYKQTSIHISTHDSVVSYLPLAHIFERIIEELALSCGAHIGYWQARWRADMKSTTT
eukprot:scaffold14.g1271.t1